MIIHPDNEGDFRRAEAHARASASAARRKGLATNLVAWCYLAEAMELLLECDRSRAEMLADGLYTIARADQRKYLEGEAMAVISDCLSMDRLDADDVARIQSLAGFLPDPEAIRAAIARNGRAKQ